MMDTKAQCPTDEVLLGFVLRTDTVQNREALLDHVFHCPRCEMKFRILNRLRQEAGPEFEKMDASPLSRNETEELRKEAETRIRALESLGTPAPKSRFARPRRVPAWAIAAGALLVVLAGLIVGTRFARKPEVYRKTGTADFRVIAPLGNLTERPSVFSWTPVVNADVYVLTIIDEDLQTIFAKKLEETTYFLEAPVRDRLEKGKTYVWRVAARADDETHLGTAKGTFVIGPPRR
jgi:hypothetical protein